jgi:hypothetical protein
VDSWLHRQVVVSSSRVHTLLPVPKDVLGGARRLRSTVGIQLDGR